MGNGEAGGGDEEGEEKSEEQDSSGKKVLSMTDGCEGFECRKLCIGPADINWPQSVGSGVLKIVLHGASESNKDCLGQVCH